MYQPKYTLSNLVSIVSFYTQDAEGQKAEPKGQSARILESKLESMSCSHGVHILSPFVCVHAWWIS